MAAADDARGIAGLIDTVGEDWLVSELDVDERAERIGALITAGDNIHLVAEADGEIVGELALAFDDPGPATLGFSVIPAWRRRGVASALVAKSLDLARARGVRELEAEVLPDNEVAVAFLKENRFRIEGRRVREGTASGEPREVLVLRLARF